MKKTLTLTESELIELVKRMVESADRPWHRREDFAEAFLHFFRPWVKEQHGDEVSQYPLSYLVKKYINDFCVDKGIEPFPEDDYDDDGFFKMVSVGEKLIEKGLHQLPTLRSKEKFTDKFKKQFDYFINKLNLPEFEHLIIEEDTPYELNIRLVVDWVPLITYSGEKTVPTSRTIETELTNNLSSYLGVDFDNPIHGGLDFGVARFTEYNGVEEWVNKVFNKEIKKKIKALPDGDKIRMMKFTPNTSSPNTQSISIYFKSEISYSNKRRLIIESINNLLSELGYNTRIIRAQIG